MRNALVRGSSASSRPYDWTFAQDTCATGCYTPHRWANGTWLTPCSKIQRSVLAIIRCLAVRSAVVSQQRWSFERPLFL
jgi:hypothetical protein